MRIVGTTEGVSRLAAGRVGFRPIMSARRTQPCSPDCGNTRGSQRSFGRVTGAAISAISSISSCARSCCQCSMPISGGHANFCGNPLTMRTVSTLVRNL